MSKNENIESLYKMLGNDGEKGEVKKAIAAKCKRKIGTVSNHWLSYFEVPEQFQDDVVDILQKAVVESKKRLEQIKVDAEEVK